MTIPLRAVAAAAALALGACTSWQPQPALTPATRFASDARVTRTDNSVVVLRTPVIAGDSLAGNAAIGQHLAIPLTSIRVVHTRRADVGRTVLAAGAVALSAVVIRSATRQRIVYQPALPHE